MNTGVSVVIPTYNGSRFIRGALESVYAQTTPPAEIVVVDDASADGTADLVEQLAATSPFPLRLIRSATNSGGPARPMNVGVEAARGDIVFTLDQDDRMRPDRIAAMSRPFARSDIALAFGLIARTDPNGSRTDVPYKVTPERLSALPGEDLEPGVRVLDGAAFYSDGLITGNFLGASNLAFRRNAWRAAGGFDEAFRVAWDYDFACRISRHGRAAFVNQVVADYCVHDGNFSSAGRTCDRESLSLRRRHLEAPLWPLDRAALRAALAADYLDAGYHEAVRGHSLRALADYREALRHGNRWTSVASGVAKILPHLLRSRFSSKAAGR